MNATENRHAEIANEILRQIGGYNRVNAMVGLKDVFVNGPGISFKMKVAGAKANYVKIQLVEAADLYNVEIGKIRGMKYKVVETFTGVFCDSLVGIIENTCKVRLSL